MGAHETVEFTVIEVGKPLLELLRLRAEPVYESVAYLVDFSIGKLYGLTVRHLYVIAVLVLAGRLLYFGHRIVQGVSQQVHAIVDAVISADAELLPYLHVAPPVGCRILVKRRGVSHGHVRSVEVGHIIGIYLRGYPPLAEIEVQLVKGYPAWRGLLQCLQGLAGQSDIRLDAVIAGKSLYALLLLHVHQCGHVVGTYLPELVERCGKSLHRGLDGCHLVNRKGDRVVEYIGLDIATVLATFQCQRVTTVGIHHDEADVALFVKVSVSVHKFIVQSVQPLTLDRICRMGIGLEIVEGLVGV